MARNEGSRGMRDEMNVGPEPRNTAGLRRLRDLEHFEIAHGEPDIRGWTVFTSTGREMGKVDDLLVDVDAGEVMMLDIDLRRDDHHTLAPIRSAWVDREIKRVVIDAAVLGEDQHPAATVPADAGPATPLATTPTTTPTTARAATPVTDASLADTRRSVRYPRGDGDEIVIDRRPMVEEVVVRRRPAGDEAADSLLERQADDPIRPT